MSQTLHTSYILLGSLLSFPRSCYLIILGPPAFHEPQKKNSAEHHQPILRQLFNSVNIPGSSALRTLKILLGPMFCRVHVGTGFSSLKLA